MKRVCRAVGEVLRSGHLTPSCKVRGSHISGESEIIYKDKVQGTKQGMAWLGTCVFDLCTRA